VTKISEAGPFCEAAAEDQEYFQRYRAGYTSHFQRRVKLAHRETAADSAGRAGRNRLNRDLQGAPGLPESRATPAGARFT
jgi:hypothetical protein